jgi:hypothetical protein
MWPFGARTITASVACSRTERAKRSAAADLTCPEV